MEGSRLYILCINLAAPWRPDLSDRRVSRWRMTATYVVRASGYDIEFSTLSSDGVAVAIRPVILTLIQAGLLGYFAPAALVI